MSNFTPIKQGENFEKEINLTAKQWFELCLEQIKNNKREKKDKNEKNKR